MIVTNYNKTDTIINILHTSVQKWPTIKFVKLYYNRLRTNTEKGKYIDRERERERGVGKNL